MSINKIPSVPEMSWHARGKAGSSNSQGTIMRLPENLDGLGDLEGSVLRVCSRGIRWQPHAGVSRSLVYQFLPKAQHGYAWAFP